MLCSPTRELSATDELHEVNVDNVLYLRDAARDFARSEIEGSPIL